MSVFLWFQEGANEAFTLYDSLFRDPRNTRGGDGEIPHNTAASVWVGDTHLMLFNGGPLAAATFSMATSIYVTADDQAAVDRYWTALTEGGRPGRCGWLTDRFGVTWQIVPRLFATLMERGDDDARGRVMTAMLQMDKFDCAALQRAYDEAR